MEFETIVSSKEGNVGFIKLNRPQILNAINKRMKKEVRQALADHCADPQVMAIVLHGEGRAFSAGFDMKESAEATTSSLESWNERLRESFDFIMSFWDAPKPSVAAVHGFCLAGGFELALACDMTVAAEGTKFGEPEVRFGSGMVALLLPWMTTPKIAAELLLTGNDQIDAQRALQAGIVNHVVEPGQELAKAVALAKDMAAASPFSVRMTRQAMHRSMDIMGMRQALLAALDTDVMIETAGGPERAEFNRIRKEQGLKAALEWRDARFVKA
jgi:enoyl-CoA hydratase